MNELEELTKQTESQNQALMTMIAWAKSQDETNKKTNEVLVEHQEEINKINDQITEIKDNDEINEDQRKELRAQGAVRIHQILSTKREYVVYSHTFFGHLWSDYKNHFDISAYGKTRRKDYQTGVDFVSAWVPKKGIQALKDEVDETNRIKEQEKLKTIFAIKDGDAV